MNDDPQNNFDCEAIIPRWVARCEATMTWEEYNDADGCDWQDTGFYPTDLNGCML